SSNTAEQKDTYQVPFCFLPFLKIVGLAYASPQISFPLWRERIATTFPPHRASRSIAGLPFSLKRKVRVALRAANRSAAMLW
ncbi:MAG: hypothetical protein ITD33_02515, partial [Nitrosarchaeum sp.]|nr:hypothetical protein [Nitrosarchaeum sp.]